MSGSGILSGTVPADSEAGVTSSATSYEEPITLPDVRHVLVEGSLSDSHDPMTLEIPVGPTTQEVGVTVRPDLPMEPGGRSHPGRAVPGGQIW